MPVYRHLLCLGCWGGLLICASDFIQLLCSPRGRFGRAKKKSLESSVQLPLGIGLWLLLILLFLSQEFPAANSAPVYGHYSHGATCTHNGVTSAQTLGCLQSHHGDSELYKAIRNTNVTSYVCVRADLAASMRSRWERGLAVQDFIPWLSCPCSAKIHTWGLLFFFCLVGFYGAKGTLGRNKLNNCSTMSEWCFIRFILMELHLPSSCVKTTEVIPVADEDKGFFLPI